MGGGVFQPENGNNLKVTFYFLPQYSYFVKSFRPILALAPDPWEENSPNAFHPPLPRHRRQPHFHLCGSNRSPSRYNCKAKSIITEHMKSSRAVPLRIGAYFALDLVGKWKNCYGEKNEQGTDPAQQTRCKTVDDPFANQGKDQLSAPEGCHQGWGGQLVAEYEQETWKGNVMAWKRNADLIWFETNVLPERMLPLATPTSKSQSRLGIPPISVKSLFFTPMSGQMKNG